MNERTPRPPRPRGRRRRRRSGYTLIELMLVLVILAVLAMVVVPKFTGKSQQARITAARTGIANIKTCLASFEVDCSRYPTTAEGLRALIEQPANATNWGPNAYLEGGLPRDPWGNFFAYKFPGDHNPTGYDLYSFGPDGQEGGGDDIGNWEEE